MSSLSSNTSSSMDDCTIIKRQSPNEHGATGNCWNKIEDTCEHHQSHHEVSSYDDDTATSADDDGVPNRRNVKEKKRFTMDEVNDERPFKRVRQSPHHTWKSTKETSLSWLPPNEEEKDDDSDSGYSDSEEDDDDDDDDENQDEFDEIVIGITKLQECIVSYQQERSFLGTQFQKQCPHVLHTTTGSITSTSHTGNSITNEGTPRYHLNQHHHLHPITDDDDDCDDDNVGSGRPFQSSSTSSSSSTSTEQQQTKYNDDTTTIASSSNEDDDDEEDDSMVVTPKTATKDVVDSVETDVKPIANMKKRACNTECNDNDNADDYILHFYRSFTPTHVTVGGSYNHHEQPQELINSSSASSQSSSSSSSSLIQQLLHSFGMIASTSLS